MTWRTQFLSSLTCQTPPAHVTLHARRCYSAELLSCSCFNKFITHHVLSKYARLCVRHMIYKVMCSCVQTRTSSEQTWPKQMVYFSTPQARGRSSKRTCKKRSWACGSRVFAYRHHERRMPDGLRPPQMPRDRGVPFPETDQGWRCNKNPSERQDK